MFCKGGTSLELDQDTTDKGKMRGDARELEPRSAGSVGDLPFAVFSFTHAGCGEEGVIELRLDERLLLGWCPSCDALEIFGSPDRPRPRRETVLTETQA